jgi:phosphoribosylanthranilate isomerase
MKHASNTLDDLVVQLHGEAENQRAQNLKAQRTRYILFIVIAFMAGALFTLLIVLLALLLK